MKKMIIPLLSLFPLFCTANKNDLNYEDFLNDHKNTGCPVNSKCSKSSGKRLVHFKKALSLTSNKTRVKALNRYKQKHGLPLNFLTTEKASLSLDPVMWKSRCPHHNPKDKKSRRYKGQRFFQNIPNSELVKLDPVILFKGKKSFKFSIPYQDIPLMIVKDQLIVPQEFNNNFYQLAISRKGKIKVVDYQKSLQKALDKNIKEVECPKENKAKIGKRYKGSYCRKIWDASHKKLRTIKLFWACP